MKLEEEERVRARSGETGVCSSMLLCRIAPKQRRSTSTADFRKEG